MLKGSLDAIHNGQCYGWALDEEATGSVEVSVFVDGQLAGAGKAEHYRLDLEQAGLRDGKVAFALICRNRCAMGATTGWKRVMHQGA